jgi:leucyl aminopeptidase
MKISCHKKLALKSCKDAIIIPIFKNAPSRKHLIGQELEDEMQMIIDSGYFNFEENEVKSFYIGKGKGLKKIYLVNVPKDIVDQNTNRELGALVGRIVCEDKLKSVSIVSLCDMCDEKKDMNCIIAALEGILFATYKFDRYKEKKQPCSLEDIEVVTDSAKLKRYVDDSTDELLSTFKYINIAKDLINTPANELTPEGFVSFVQANALPELQLTVWDDKKLLEDGLNLVAAVGRGSANAPRFVKLSYAGAPESEKNVAIVGKGITFDSGGSNLKPTGSMEDMKHDMAGAASVYAVANLIAEQKLPINLHAYIPLAENIIGGNAIRPGDVITSYSGKTVEVLNTDAEGRLILADALYMATQTKPEVIIDIATLTGAAVIALGESCAAAFSNRKFLSKQLCDIASKVGEPVWELPLLEVYAKRLKSKVADLQNMSTVGRSAGTVMAALFLKEFVDNYPWIHLDVAGTAYLERAHPIWGTQATGFGIRLMYTLIKGNYA